MQDCKHDNTKNEGKLPGISTPPGGVLGTGGSLPYLLEYITNTVTLPTNEHGARFEVSKCRCDCWFCPECCMVMGYKLRVRLMPILETFKGLIMVTLTIDPKLFPDPKTAYIYTMDRRCISRTTQDLDRWGYLHTRRYFYVIEWQKFTEMVHFHILYDSSYIPFDKLLESWSKHRPKSAGAVHGERPAFGTVLFSAPKFADHVHAARYATKYLIKTPEHGYPDWVLNMGANRRIRRYSASRGFWNTPSKPNKGPPEYTRKNTRKTYSQRIGDCGDSLHVMEIVEAVNSETGEISPKRFWLGQVEADSDKVIDRLFDPGNPERKRRSLLASDLIQVMDTIQNITKQPVSWKSRRGARC